MSAWTEILRFESSSEVTDYPIVTYKEEDTWYAYPMGMEECEVADATLHKAIAKLQLIYPHWYEKKKEKGEEVPTVEEAHRIHQALCERSVAGAKERVYNITNGKKGGLNA